MCCIFAAICLNNIGGLCTNIYTHSWTEKSISDACTCMDAYICMVIQRRFSLFAKLSRRIGPHQMELRMCKFRGIIRENLTSSKPTTGWMIALGFVRLRVKIHTR